MSNLNEKAKTAASRFLQHRGYEILEMGWESPAGAADIIAEDCGTLVFADVKARRDIDRGLSGRAGGRRREDAPRDDRAGVPGRARHGRDDRPLRQHRPGGRKREPGDGSPSHWMPHRRCRHAHPRTSPGGRLDLLASSRGEPSGLRAGGLFLLVVFWYA